MAEGVAQNNPDPTLANEFQEVPVDREAAMDQAEEYNPFDEVEEDQVLRAPIGDSNFDAQVPDTYNNTDEMYYQENQQQQYQQDAQYYADEVIETSGSAQAVVEQQQYDQHEEDRL